MESRLTCNVARSHSHLVRGESARFVGADGGGVTHAFARVQVSHEVSVLHHSLDVKTSFGTYDFKG